MNGFPRQNVKNFTVRWGPSPASFSHTRGQLVWGQCLEYGSSQTSHYLWLRGQSGWASKLPHEGQALRCQVQDSAFPAFLSLLNPGLPQGFMAIARESGENVPRGVQEPSLFHDSWYPTKVIAGPLLIRRHIPRTKRVPHQSSLESGSAESEKTL